MWKKHPTRFESRVHDFDHRTGFLIHCLELFRKVILMTSKTSSFPLSARLGLWISTTTIRRLLLPSLAIGAISTYTCFFSRIGNNPFRTFILERVSALGTVGLTGGDRGGPSLSETFSECDKIILLNSVLIRFRLFPEGLITYTHPLIYPIVALKQKLG